MQLTADVCTGMLHYHHKPRACLGLIISFQIPDDKTESLDFDFLCATVDSNHLESPVHYSSSTLTIDYVQNANRTHTLKCMEQSSKLTREGCCAPPRRRGHNDEVGAMAWHTHDTCSGSGLGTRLVANMPYGPLVPCNFIMNSKLAYSIETYIVIYPLFYYSRPKWSGMMRLVWVFGEGCGVTHTQCATHACHTYRYIHQPHTSTHTRTFISHHRSQAFLLLVGWSSPLAAAFRFHGTDSFFFPQAFCRCLAVLHARVRFPSIPARYHHTLPT